jgi:hypothetical protein
VQVTDDPYQEWTAFYVPFMASPAEALSFVKSCEDAQPLRHPSRIIMHQCCRLVTLASDVATIYQAHHGLQVLFLVMCAEATAKLHAQNTTAGGSKRSVYTFFKDLLPNDARRDLVDGFRNPLDEPVGLDEIIEALYKVRCAAAHEGDYWSVFFSHDGVPTASRGWSIVTTLSIEAFTKLVVDGCVAAARSKLDNSDDDDIDGST